MPFSQLVTSQLDFTAVHRRRDRPKNDK